MEITTFAYSIGILEILMSLPLIFYPKAGKKWLDHFLKEDMLLRVVGCGLTVISALVLLDSYTVSLEPEGVVRLVAWLLFFKGLMLTWWPQTAVQMKKKWLKSEGLLTFAGLVGTAIGMLLIYAGSIL